MSLLTQRTPSTFNPFICTCDVANAPSSNRRGSARLLVHNAPSTNLVIAEIAVLLLGVLSEHYA